MKAHKSREPKSSKRRVRAEVRQAKAISLRVAGLSLAEIAHHLVADQARHDVAPQRVQMDEPMDSS